MKIVAVTACPTGIAHTYMAAEALSIAAKELSIDLKVETRGSVGAENPLTDADIEAADAVIVAADTATPMERFNGKKLVNVSVKEAIKDPKALIEAAKVAEVFGKAEVQASKPEKSESAAVKKRPSAYKHLMNGVSFMIPFVTAGGILIALSFIFGIKAFEQEGTLAAALMKIGGGSAFSLMVPILAGYIAYSIADRPGLVPGMVSGVLASSLGAGFLGGILGGFLAGYVVEALKKTIKLPKSMQGLMPVLILPVLSTLIVGLVMIYILGGPVAFINKGLNDWLSSLKGTNAAVLGLILGLMMAVDMGGPINKAAYTFGVGTLAAGQPSAVMAAVMAAGMVPPLAVALATVIAKNKFTLEEREAGKAAWALGASFISEGAIPFAAADPARVIPSIMAGAAVTGALSMIFGCGLAVPHGGVFVLAIPNAVVNLPMYLVSIVAGTVVSAFMLSVLKNKI